MHLRFRSADWGRVLFTGNSRINFRRSDGWNCVYQRRRERYNDICVRERGQFGGGSVMVWAGILLHTKTPMIPIHRNLNTHITANRGMVLMQDNATPHTARRPQQVLQGHNIRLLDWPPCSRDLNPTEHVWDEIDRRVTASSAAEPSGSGEKPRQHLE